MSDYFEKLKKTMEENNLINNPSQIYNICCVRFRTYEDQEEETGFSWVKYMCQRWIHEDCYSEVVMDKHRRELICPYCVV